MHHWDAIAALDQKEQVAFAKNAAEKDWTVLELRDAIRENKCPETPELPKGKYQVIYADPPWPYNAEQHGREAQKTVLADHYGSKSIEWLCDLPIRDLAAPNAVLFLWTTSPKIFEGAQQVIDAWGFEYKSSMVWDKVKHNVGYYVSVRHEFLLICTKGSCLPDNRKLYDSVVTVERTGHSEKPDRFYEIIEDLYHGRKIELFARKKRSGWESWGNQL
jgi:N6-adenosine-specific RNA methylase IME4